MKTVLAISALTIATSAFAQVSPEIGGETTGLNTPLRNAPRVYQAYYAASAFSLTSDTVLTGLQFQLYSGTGGTWPSSDINFSDYTVTLGVASAGLVSDGEYLSSTQSFASSFAPGKSTVVRSGALGINANTYSVGTFGPAISFSTPYTLKQGDSLVLQINHTGYTGGAAQVFFSAGDFANGVSDAISSTASGTATSANGFSSPMIVNFTTQAVPEPTSMVALGLGAVALLRRRARKA